MDVFNEVKIVLETVLNLDSGSVSFTRETQLLGGIPEFDSMAVMGVLNALEEHLGIFFDEDEITADIFETMGSFVDFVQTKL